MSCAHAVPLYSQFPPFVSFLNVTPFTSGCVGGAPMYFSVQSTQRLESHWYFLPVLVTLHTAFCGMPVGSVAPLFAGVGVGGFWSKKVV